MDVLSVMDTDEVALELGDEHSPGVVHAPGDRASTSVVMPMRV
jgi:DNA polymerase-3 subunit beta